MSNQANIHSRKGIKSKKVQTTNEISSPINPEILTYIQKVQNDNDKVKVMKDSKNNMPIQVERIIQNKLMNINNFSGLNEDMTYDKDKRFTAKKGLLYLLNNLSNGTFCPDIEEYFSKMKDAKMEELKHKSRILELTHRTGDEMDGKRKDGRKKSKEPTLKKILNNMDNNMENTKKESKAKYFRKNIDSELGEEIGIKKYENDYDAEDLRNLYDSKDKKENAFQINYNKEKLIRMKLKNENKNN